MSLFRLTTEEKLTTDQINGPGRYLASVRGNKDVKSKRKRRERTRDMQKGDVKSKIREVLVRFSKQRGQRGLGESRNGGGVL